MERTKVPFDGARHPSSSGARGLARGGRRWSPAALLLCSTLIGCHDAEAQPPLAALTRASVPAGEEQFEVPPPPLSEGIFPCSDCHDPELPLRTRRRELKHAHEEIEFRHDEENRWCLDCHDAENRDVLHLASGAPVAFEESHRLCGQCHGDKYRDWRAGIHGRRSGSWDGEKLYQLCVHCHDAHDPAFKPLVPEPAPIPPERTP